MIHTNGRLASLLRKSVWGLSVLALVFGMAVIGCDDGSKDDSSGGGGSGTTNPFVGTWKATTTGATVIFNADLTWTYTSTGAGGTYSTSGNTATLQSSAVAFNGKTATISNSSLTWNVIGLSILTFTKE